MPNYTHPELPADEIEDSGADGEVITSTGGNGTQFEAVQTEPNVPNWEEDANSPLSYTNQTSGTITLAGAYDVVRCVVTHGIGGTAVGVQVNGDTGTNYEYMNLSGTETTGAAEWDYALRPDRAEGMEMYISGKWDASCGFSNRQIQSKQSPSVSGENTSVVSPLDSITFLSSGGISHDLTVRVYGL